MQSPKSPINSTIKTNRRNSPGRVSQSPELLTTPIRQFTLLISSYPRLNRLSQHPIDLIEIEVAERRRNHLAVGKSLLSNRPEDHPECLRNHGSRHSPRTNVSGGLGRKNK